MSTPNGPGMLRIGDAERVAAATALGDHFAAGRLDQAEFDERLGRAYAARTYADLEPLFADLPQPHPRLAAPTGPTGPAAGAEATGALDPAGAGPAWRRAPDWQSLGRAFWDTRHPAAMRVAKTVVVLSAALLVAGILMAVLPFLLLFGLVMLVSGGPRRHGHWQRWHGRPIGRPPWGGDNAAWYQFGWTSRDWSHTTGRGRPGHGYPRHGLPDQRPHRRRH